MLEKAGDTNDYDSSLAVDQLITYLASPQGTPVTEILIKQSIDIIDEISAEVVDYVILTTPLLSFQSMGTSFFERLQKVGKLNEKINLYLFYYPYLEKIHEKNEKKNEKTPDQT